VKDVVGKELTRLVFLRRVLLALVVVVSLLASSFVALHWGFNVPNVSAVTSSPTLGVYWDAACTRSVSSVGWGNVSAGSEKDVTVYIKNQGSSGLIPSMNMSALTPSMAYLKIYLCWNYGGQQVGPGSVVKVTLRLFVATAITGVTTFSFNINIGVGLEKSPDINGDGKVSGFDLLLLSKAWGHRAGEPSYDYRCDLTNNGLVNAGDMIILQLAWE
jgi:hypothetical protein